MVFFIFLKFAFMVNFQSGDFDSLSQQEKQQQPVAFGLL